MIVAASGGYPWQSDPGWTDALIADAKYLDTTGAVGLLRAHKGRIDATQASFSSKPTYSAGWGSGNAGMLTADGINDCLEADALAAKVTGLQPFTTITAIQALTVGAIKDAWAFSNLSNTTSGHSLQLGTEANNPWRAAMQDDSGVLRVGTSGFLGDTTRVVITLTFNGISAWTMRINGVAQTVAHLGTAPGATTHSKFTLFGFRGSSLIACMNANFRAFLFGPSVLPLSSIVPAENYLIAEKA